jgi:transcriptional regulator with XRE-family HTH domain
MSAVPETFGQWLIQQTNTQGFRSLRQLALKAGLAHTTVYDVANGVARAGPDFCRAIARALRLPPEAVFRKAGLLPPEPDADEDEERLVHLFRSLPGDERQRILLIAATLLEKQKREEAERRRHPQPT